MSLGVRHDREARDGRPDYFKAVRVNAYSCSPSGRRPDPRMNI